MSVALYSSSSVDKATAEASRSSKNRSFWPAGFRSRIVSAFLFLICSAFLPKPVDAGTWAPTGGPQGGEILTIAISPDYPVDRTLFVGTKAGGVFKTTDAGADWTPANADLTALNIRSLAISSNYGVDQTLFAAAGSEIFKSTTGGSTWIVITAPTSLGISSLSVSPDYSTDQTLFAGTFGGGVLKSTNGGASWVEANVGLNVDPVNPSSVFTVAVALSPNFGVDQTIFVGIRSRGVFRSTDGGATWIQVNTGLGSLLIGSVALSPDFATDQTIFVGTNGGVFKSVTGGDDWMSVEPQTGLTCVGVNTLVVLSPNYSVDQMVFAGSDCGVIRSVDGGINWAEANTGFDTPSSALSVASLAVSPEFATDQSLFVGTRGAGLFKSTNAGDRWTAANNGLAAHSVTSLGISGNYLLDETLFAGTGAGGVFKSSDGAATWAAGNVGIGRPLIAAVAISPSYQADETVFVGTRDAGVFKSSDGGTTWEATNSGLVSLGIQTLIVSPNYEGDGTVFALTQSGIFKSSDRGNSWSALNFSALSLAVSPNYGTDNTIFAGKSGINPSSEADLYRSTDGGVTWVPIESGLQHGQGVAGIAVSPSYAIDQTLLVIARFSGNIFRSTDGGESWTGLASLATSRGSLLASPQYAVDQTVFSWSDSALLKSPDGGVTWVVIDSGLPSPIRSLAVSPGYPCDGTVFVGTDGASVWSYLDTEAMATCLAPPGNVIATPVATSNTQVNIYWTVSPDSRVTGYRIERCGGGTPCFTQVALVPGVNYTDSGLFPDTGYSYRIAAIDAAGNSSPYSDTASVRTHIFATFPPPDPGLILEMDPSDPAHINNLNAINSALARFFNDRQEFPARLEQLVPGYLPVLYKYSTIRDYFYSYSPSDRPMHYHLGAPLGGRAPGDEGALASDSDFDSARAGYVGGFSGSDPMYDLVEGSGFPPPRPTGLIAEVGDGQITLSWTPVPGASSYNVYMATGSGVTKANFNTLPGGLRQTGITSPFTQTGLINGTTYYFVLTAVNAVGESSESVEVSTTPHPPAAATLILDVVADDSGTPLPGALVAVSDDTSTYITDANGRALIATAPGPKTIFAFKDGYKPVSQFIDVTPLDSNVTLRLPPGDVLVVDQVTTTALTPEEITARGVQLSDPTNYWVYDFTVTLAVGGVPTTIDQMSMILPSNPTPGTSTLLPPTTVSSGGGTASVQTTVVALPGGHRAYAFLVIPGDVKLLKEFFDATVIMKSEASAEFVITGLTAALTIPPSVALVPINGSVQPAVKTLGDLSGGAQAETTWVLRGDAEGTHTLGVSATGTLQPFGIRLTSGNSGSVRVLGAPTLNVNFQFPGRVDAETEFVLTADVTNTSLITARGVSMELLPGQLGNVLLGVGETSAKSIGSLAPNETARVTYRLIPQISGCLNLVGASIVSDPNLTTSVSVGTCDPNRIPTFVLETVVVSPVADFSSTSSTATVGQGSAATYRISAMSIFGFDSDVTLSVQGTSPADPTISAALDRTVIAPGYSSAAQLVVTTSAATPGVFYTIRIQGTDGTQQRDATVYLDVRSLGPENLVAEAWDREIDLSWDPSILGEAEWDVEICRGICGVVGDWRRANTLGPVKDNPFFSVLIDPQTGVSLMNGQPYSFRVISHTGVGTYSEIRAATPIQPPQGALPTAPLVLVHGICSDGSTWENVVNRLIQLGWNYGGDLTNGRPSQLPAIGPVSFPADFYTVTFENPTANYADGVGIKRWAAELANTLAAVAGTRDLKFTLVAHSMGGLAARWYIQDPAEQWPQKVQHLVSYGTPHRGTYTGLLASVLNYWPGPCFGAWDAAVSFSNGVRDMLPSSDFLDELNNLNQVPPAIKYTSIIGAAKRGTFIQLEDNIPPSRTQLSLPIRQGVRIGDYRVYACYGAVFGVRFGGCDLLTSVAITRISVSQVEIAWRPPADRRGLVRYEVWGFGEAGCDDGAVACESQKLSNVPSYHQRPVRQLWTHKTHIEETSDLGALLCAINLANCLQFLLYSPVDLEIRSPSGALLNNEHSEIWGASYQETASYEGPHVVITIPFPESGDYSVRLIPHANAGPTDVYSLIVNRGEVSTMLADRVEIQGAPTDPMTVPVDLAPSVAAALSSGPNTQGWHNADVTVTFTCTDPEAQIATCTGPITVSTEGAGQIITGTAVDAAGNRASTSVTINLDKTPPALTCPPDVTIFATVPLGTAPTNSVIQSFLAAASATDNLDGAVSIAPTAPPFFPLGTTDVSFIGADDAGNQGACQATVTVTNPAPVFDSVANKLVDEGQSLVFTVSATDPNGEPLVYAATGLPPGASFDATTRTFSWTPTYSQAGPYSVTFTASDGTSTDSETVIITVRDVPPPGAPGVTAASPAEVSYGITPSRSVTLVGTGFALGSRITVGSLSGVTVSGTTASATTPFVFTNSGQVKFYWANMSLAPGAYDVQVTNPDGSSGTLAGGFAVEAPQPAVTSVTPSSLTYDVSPSQSVTIFGSNFVSGATITVGSVSGATVQGFNATTSTPFVYVNSSQVKFYWDKTALPPGSYAVQVTNPAAAGGLSASLANGFAVTAPEPAVTSLDIASVTYGITPSRPITIFGDNFVVGARITVGSISGETVAGTTASATTPLVFVSRSRLSFYWPNTALPPGAYDVQVTNTPVSGGQSATLAGGFTVLAPQPTVTSVSPTPVTYGISPSTSITIFGSNFIVGGTVTVGSLTGTTASGSVATATARFVHVSSTQVRFYWPNTALPPGAYAAQVSNPASAGGLAASLADAFTVSSPQPTISSLTPSLVTYGISPGMSIAVSGSHFIVGARITVGSLSGNTVAGSVATVTTPFVYTSSGSLRFYWPNTSLAPGLYAIQVTNPASAGGLSATLASAFTVAAPQPTVTSVVPSPVTYGVTPSVSITLFGTNFVVGAQVTVGALTGNTVAGSVATASTPFVWVSSTTLRVWWPNTSLPAGTYDVTVTNPGVAGGLATTLAGGFVIAPPQPTISALSPTPMTFGSTSLAVTIFGGNFVPGATITVGALTGTTVNGATATASIPFVYVNSGTLRFWWPSTSLPAGSYTVTVTNPSAAGAGSVSLTGGFVVQ